ncbi:hypothetical protein DUNSADRAFT_16025 [Dunaliella salina]|uniref:Uncharacterized protein n=1 Tax=Dunaliella salina TaxID=3046 RepID=A0ABQ7H1C1_DUNSA|nr:hypothetical protein DUNSADRAFT_16025 [Dunaliella salina]|eukprot:KAF5840652.1 hypothetical protein DUNSADRAFT_16025 [Dunaliella salina]
MQSQIATACKALACSWHLTLCSFSPNIQHQECSGSPTALLAQDTLIGLCRWLTCFTRLYSPSPPTDARVQRPLKMDGAIVWGARYFELAYDIEATNLDDADCPLKDGARFCYMREDESSDIPDFLPSYKSWLEPYCADVPPPGDSSCYNQKSWGKCYDDFMTSPNDIDAKALGSHCAVTCGRCTAGEFSCADRAPPNSLSGWKSCSQLKEDCACFQWWMEEGNFCATTCGFGKCEDKSSQSDGGCEDILPPGGSSCEEQRCFGKCYDDWMYRGDYCQNTCGRCNECRDLQPNSGYSCAQHRDWGDCGKSWMKDGRLCEATCCVCGGCTLEPVCNDKEPAGGSCWQRKEWGSCAEQWMKDGGYCKKTCGFDPCPPVCDDVEPDGGVRCWQRKEWGNCDDQWMKDGGYCRKTCGFDPCDPVCDDKEPPGGVSCWQRRDWGNCNDQWMKDGGYCARTCGLWPCQVCDDVQPSGDASCWQRKQWGNCGDQWMKDGQYCAKTCGFFPCPAA